MPKSSRKPPKRASEPRKRTQAGTRPTRKGTRRTQAQVAASRANGQSGGRKPGERHLEDFEIAGPAPLGEPLKLARWTQTLLAIDLQRQITGRAHRELSQSIRATATTMSRAMPADIIVEAELLIRSDGAELEADAGPQLEVVAAAGPWLHCAADANRGGRR